MIGALQSFELVFRVRIITEKEQQGINSRRVGNNFIDEKAATTL